MKKTYTLLLGLALFYGCNDNVQQEQELGNAEGFSNQLELESNRRVSLTAPATEAVSQWLAYATAQHEIRELETATGHQIITSSQPLAEIMATLQSTIPDTLQVVPVEARANVLTTKAEVLQQLSAKKNKDSEEIFKAANDLIFEFENFKLQLNERFLTTPQDFELELDREFEESLSPASEEPAQANDSIL